VLTGVSFDGKNLGAASLDAAINKTAYAGAPIIEGFYPGTGDVFASVLVAGLLTSLDLTSACRIAVDFTAESIARTKLAGTDVRWGVSFETGLKDLAVRFG
jgi:pyridoxine kinase